jgi:IS605 OrfB family transposase
VKNQYCGDNVPVQEISLKLKLLPSKEQAARLDEAFGKWASLCNRVVAGADIKELAPRSAPGLQFSKTQLHQVQKDVNEHKEALSRFAKRKEWERQKEEERRDRIVRVLQDPASREYEKPDSRKFRLKPDPERPWTLKTKYKTEAKYRGDLKESKRKIKRIQKTVDKIKKGKITFKPRRIGLWNSSYRVSFAPERAKVLLSPFAGKTHAMEIPIVVQPEKPAKKSASQAASFAYLQKAIQEFLAFSLRRKLAGMSSSQRALSRAKRPEKVARFEEQMTAKKSSLGKKVEKIEQATRPLTEAERQLLEQGALALIAGKDAPAEFNELTVSLASLLQNKTEPLKLEQYPILIRKPINRAKEKRITNLRPDEWKYYIQFAYEPSSVPARQPKNYLGVDRGLHSSLALAVYNPATRGFPYNRLYANETVRWKWHARNLRRAILRLERRLRAQKGIHLKENQMKKGLRSIENRIEDYFHRISREVVDAAQENDAAIVMEYLSGMKQSGRGRGRRLKGLNYALSNFDYEKVARLINYKAQNAGIPVYEIDAAGTSQNCAMCLINGRESQANFHRGIDGNTKRAYCDTCRQQTGNDKSEIDADLNAARVIAAAVPLNLGQPRPFGTEKARARRA